MSLSRAFLGLVGALTLAGGACAISFDGYELADGSSTGTGGDGASGGAQASASGQGAASGGGAGPTSATASASAGGASTGGGPSSSSVGGGGGTGGSPPTCPSQGGLMVAVPVAASDGYCIDATEVTQGDYDDFLGIPPDTANQPPGCEANTFDIPTGADCVAFTPSNKPDVAVSCVDWCDAVGYCKQYGKRLCGKIGGGSLDVGMAATASESQWFNACSDGGTKVYPYGDDFNEDTCAGAENLGAVGPQDVNMWPGCTGGLPGIRQMSGNVREWEDGCTGGECLQRGGSTLEFSSGNPHNLRCDSDGLEPRGQRNSKVGFRCCADL